MNLLSCVADLQGTLQNLSLLLSLSLKYWTGLGKGGFDEDTFTFIVVMAV